MIINSFIPIGLVYDAVKKNQRNNAYCADSTIKSPKVSGIPVCADNDYTKAVGTKQLALMH